MLVICKKCGIPKEQSEQFFYPSTSAKSGFIGTCKDCYRRKSRNRFREIQYSRRKNLRAIREEMLQKIGSIGASLCDICGRLESAKCPKAITERRNLAQDHCHETGMNRGFLCQKCNMMLGCANDNSDILANAIVYLKLWDKLHNPAPPEA